MPQALVEILLCRKLLDQMEVVAASGFEPPTSWYRNAWWQNALRAFRSYIVTAKRADCTNATNDEQPEYRVRAHDF